MAIKERYQNPAIDDEIKLRLLTYNSNNLSDLYLIEKIEIYFLDENAITAENPDGLTLVETIDAAGVIQEDVGTYRLNVFAEDTKYRIGRYRDVWTVKAYEDQPSHTIVQVFKIYPNLWYSSPIPIVYNFSFSFQPNKLRKGSSQFLIIEIMPNVPSAGNLRQYYENLAIVSDLKITIEQSCGDCMPQETDLRMIVEDDSVDYREKRFGYYKLDTTDMDCGLYDIWFKLEFGGNVYISDRFKLQIYN